MKQDTICALATPPGGAIAIVRVSGPDAIAITDNIFSKAIKDAEGFTLHFGQIVDMDGKELDEVLVSVFRAPHSYTGEDSTEISCHGSPYIVKNLLESLIWAGARQAEPGEFTMRAFMNGKLDLSQAEAVADLIASSTQATHQMALSQMRGQFSNELKDLQEQLLHLTSLLELDFNDQDVEFANRQQLSELMDKVEAHIKDLADSFQTGNAIKNGIPVAIIGAPNVGKSTLLNALLGEERAIVSNIQGTTRDLIEDTTQIGGITFRFIDTAGIRKTQNKLERMGIERSIQAAEKAQIILLLTESNQPFPDIEFREDQVVLQVISKCDLTLPSSSYLYHRPEGRLFHISAANGDGMSLLRKALVRESSLPATLDDTHSVVTNVRHYNALQQALEALRRAKQAFTAQTPTDLVAEDLRTCLHHLAEITGSEITSDDVLHNIFSH
ncbi:MAG: tRNA uridine-5-carboxymethylaminomethyl(34) synthesis GTPase MnmE, partial [Bacteroidaceae bacterium]|nr:tRNA uridine-5-carboxymethylaminomethyl(34) synthesis GTPase MnmE [Bacteroidaceae bacterium]